MSLNELHDDNSNEDAPDDAAIASALRSSLYVAGVAVALMGTALVVFVLTRPKTLDKRSDIRLPTVRPQATVELPTIPFKEIANTAGVNWQHFNGMEGEKLLPETMGGAVAFLDYDRDGDQDLVFAGGIAWPWSNGKGVSAPNNSLALYANQGSASFRLATEECGLSGRFYAMGLATGDFDNDGWCDLFVTAVGENKLFRNNNGKFVDVTSSASLTTSADSWSTSACWFDYDRDGQLDLFVCNYVDWSRTLDLSLGSTLTGIGRAYGQPTNFSGTFCSLFHNLGNGRFDDVSQRAGIQVRNPNTQVPVGKALGVVTVDADCDGWQDIIVANDTVQNFLFINQRNGTFQESGILAGIAFDRSGNSTGAMGIDAAWLRNDDSLAVAIGNFANEPASLYISQGRTASFFDAAMATGIGPMTKLSLTFGMLFCDLDLDGRQDIVCANGHLEADIAKVQPNQQYAQASQFFWNAGKQGAAEFLRLDSRQVGDDALRSVVGRGAAYGDLDSDGDLDLVIVANGSAPLVLRNDQQTGHHYLRVQLEGVSCNRDGMGAIIHVDCAGITQRRLVTTGRSYLSACELPQTFGLGKNTMIDKVEVEWPGGHKQVLTQVATDQLLVIRQAL